MKKYFLIIVVILINNLYADSNEFKNIKLIAPNHKIYMIIGNDKVSGYSGCNNFVSDIVLNSNLKQISFPKVTSTKKLCIDKKANKLELEFLQNLQKVKYYTLTHLNLYLKDDSHNIIYKFNTIHKVN